MAGIINGRNVGLKADMLFIAKGIEVEVEVSPIVVIPPITEVVNEFPNTSVSATVGGSNDAD